MLDLHLEPPHDSRVGGLNLIALCCCPLDPCPCTACRTRWQVPRQYDDSRLTYGVSPLYRLELGAGGGLVGLAVARGCATGAPLYITDQLEMFSLMEHNIAFNNLVDKAKARILNW